MPGNWIWNEILFIYDASRLASTWTGCKSFTSEYETVLHKKKSIENEEMVIELFEVGIKKLKATRSLKHTNDYFNKIFKKMNFEKKLFTRSEKGFLFQFEKWRNFEIKPKQPTGAVGEINAGARSLVRCFEPNRSTHAKHLLN